jgi:peptidoglycan/xylan/chitin deacetylase (PgdA/CDA1 family)
MLNNRITNIVFFLLLFTVILSDVFGNVSGWTYAIVIIVYAAVHAYGSINLSARFFLPVKFRGDGAVKAIALTFDDGPIPGNTERILDILKDHQAKAAFFCIGFRIKDHPQLVKRIHDEGHVLGNHSYWHSKTFDLQSSGKIAAELTDTDTEILNTIGLKPKFFRPPYGVTNPMVASAVKEKNYTTIGWSIRSFDTMIKDPVKLFKRVTAPLKAGDVILFHDYCESTIEILPQLLDHIAKAGLKIERVDALLNEQAYE